MVGIAPERSLLAVVVCLDVLKRFEWLTGR